MIEQDTIKLLRECDAGVKMGVSSLDGFYMTTRTNFYQMLERFDIEGIKYDYELIYNTGDNIAFKLRYSVAR